MAEGQRQQGAHIPPVLPHRQRLREEEPGAGVPVVPGQQQLPLRHIDHGGARRVPRAAEHAGREPAELDRPLPQPFQGRQRAGEIGVFLHMERPSSGFVQRSASPECLPVLARERHVLAEDLRLRKPAGAERMVVMAVGQQQADRLLRQRGGEGRRVLEAEASVDQQRLPASAQQGHAHAERVLDMKDIGQYFPAEKAHSSVPHNRGSCDQSRTLFCSACITAPFPGRFFYLNSSGRKSCRHLRHTPQSCPPGKVFRITETRLPSRKASSAAKRSKN